MVYFTKIKIKLLNESCKKYSLKRLYETKYNFFKCFQRLIKTNKNSDS